MKTTQAVTNYLAALDAAGFIMDSENLVTVAEFSRVFVLVADNGEEGYTTAVFHKERSSGGWGMGETGTADFEGCPRCFGEDLEGAMAVFADVCQEFAV